MAISSALNIGAQGMQTGRTQLDRAANDVARLNTETRPGDSPVMAEPTATPSTRSTEAPLESAMVDQVQAKHLVQSNARTVEVASDNLGTLLDLRA